MGGAPEDEVGAAQLLEVPQALELRRVEYLARHRVQPEVPVHRVIEDLRLGDGRAPNMLAWKGCFVVRFMDNLMNSITPSLHQTQEQPATSRSC